MLASPGALPVPLPLNHISGLPSLSLPCPCIEKPGKQGFESFGSHCTPCEIIKKELRDTGYHLQDKSDFSQDNIISFSTKT
jgi:hypothetical protein